MKTKGINLNLIFAIILFAIISILSIYTSSSFLKPSMANLYLKQLFFYGIGGLVTIFITYKGFDLLKRYHFLIYLGINLLLLALLIFGVSVNGSKCWFFIGPISFQPSEIMKISLIITLGEVIVKFKAKKEKRLKDEFFLIVKLLILTLIPSILTFKEPDTGVVIIYFLIFLTFIWLANLSKRWYVIGGLLGVFLIGTFFFLYVFSKDLFLNMVGENIFYRIDRIFNWASSSGFQLENSIMAIASSHITGFGFNKNQIYFPEPATDFIFTTFVTNFGFLGAIFLLFVILVFDSLILNLARKRLKLIDKYIVLGIFMMLFYGQVQNISMTLGLLPITGIPLPFISYGGSSLISYMFVVGIILNIEKNFLKYRN